MPAVFFLDPVRYRHVNTVRYRHVDDIQSQFCCIYRIFQHKNTFKHNNESSVFSKDLFFWSSQKISLRIPDKRRRIFLQPKQTVKGCGVIILKRCNWSLKLQYKIKPCDKFSCKCSCNCLEQSLATTNYKHRSEDGHFWLVPAYFMLETIFVRKSSHSTISGVC